MECFSQEVIVHIILGGSVYKRGANEQKFIFISFSDGFSGIFVMRVSVFRFSFFFINPGASIITGMVVEFKSNSPAISISR